MSHSYPNPVFESPSYRFVKAALSASGTVRDKFAHANDEPPRILKDLVRAAKDYEWEEWKASCQAGFWPQGRDPSLSGLRNEWLIKMGRSHETVPQATRNALTNALEAYEGTLERKVVAGPPVPKELRKPRSELDKIGKALAVANFIRFSLPPSGGLILKPEIETGSRHPMLPPVRKFPS